MSNPHQQPPSPSALSLSSPSDYMVGIRIGEGSFGTVLYGRHKQSQRTVAIKVLLKVALQKEPALLASVLQERALLTQCTDCPHVIDLWASFHDSNCCYLVTDCATRGTLANVLIAWHHNHDTHAAGQPPDDEIVLEYTRQLLCALAYLHDDKRRIVHADVKPANILVSDSGVLQLCDFGSAFVLPTRNDSRTKQTPESSSSSSSSSWNSTRSTTSELKRTLPRGTAEFAAPELIRYTSNSKDDNHDNKNSSTISAAVDLWSLACVVLCFMREDGSSPFCAPSEALVLDKIRAFCNLSRDDDQQEKDRRCQFLIDNTLQHHHHDGGGDHANSATHGDIIPFSNLKELVLTHWLHPDPTQRGDAQSVLTSEHYRHCFSWKLENLFVATTTINNNSCKEADAASGNATACAAAAAPPPIYLPPRAPWWTKAHSTPMRDGSQGWSAFVME